MLDDAVCRACRFEYAVSHRYAPFPSIDRPHGVLTLKEFAFTQRREAEATLQTIVYECWRTYRRALTLTRPGKPLPDAFEARPDRDLGPLLLGWGRVCVWYREHMFDLQLDLFTCPHDSELIRWHRWVDRHCTTVILDQPLWVRTVLETLGYLPKLTQSDDSNDLGCGSVTACFEAIINTNEETYYVRRTTRRPV
jgi:hypothetical protein